MANIDTPPMGQLPPGFQDPDLARPRDCAMREIAPGIHQIEGFFPPSICAIQTTRMGGVSQPPFDQLNLGSHVGDDPQAVLQNRDRLAQACKADLIWLNQVHGTQVAEHGPAPQPPGGACADAIVASSPGRACLVMTADCLPLLVARPAHQQVAAIHAGWRGLCDGVIESTLDRLVGGTQNTSETAPETASETTEPDYWWVWLGPAIGPGAFEVGPEVRSAFVAQDAMAANGFRPSPTGQDKWLADLGFLARLRLQHWFDRLRADRALRGQSAAEVVVHVAQQNDCVYSQPERYFSYRRDRVTGRMASLISLI